MTNTAQSNTDIVIDAIIEMLINKDPLFETQKEEYKQKLTVQYETYVMTNLMGLLTDDKADEFQNLLLAEPMNKQKHNAYLMFNVPDFENKVIELAQSFVANYRDAIGQM